MQDEAIFVAVVFFSGKIPRGPNQLHRCYSAINSYSSIINLSSMVSTLGGRRPREGEKKMCTTPPILFSDSVVI